MQYLDFYDTINKENLHIINQYKFYRCFNVSVIRHNDEFLYAVRVRLQNKVDDSDKLIPGNSPRCGSSIGSNFWWNRWQDWNGEDITLFFLGNHKFNKYRLLRFKNEIPRNFYVSRLIKEEFMSDGDVRLNHYKNKILIQTANLHHIVSIEKIEDDYIYPEYYRGIRSPNGHSQQLIDINIGNNDIMLALDWFDKYGVRIIRSHWRRDVELYIPYDNFIILGKGSTDNDKNQKLLGTNYGISPGLSFSTPLLKLKNDVFLGVGHLKISTNNKYIGGSNIDIFKRDLKFYMNELFGNKYIEHLGTGNCKGFIYMMYFYILHTTTDLNTENWNMIISNAYLPIKKNNNNKYRFSLCYPMGLEYIDNQTIVVTGGEGDYYAFALKLDLQSVLDSCVHDIKNLDFRKYKYKLLICN